MYRSFVDTNVENVGVSKKKFGGYMGLLGFKSNNSHGNRYYKGLTRRMLVDIDEDYNWGTKEQINSTKKVIERAVGIPKKVRSWGNKVFLCSLTKG
jgi:hypothetical protein